MLLDAWLGVPQRVLFECFLALLGLKTPENTQKTLFGALRARLPKALGKHSLGHFPARAPEHSCKWRPGSQCKMFEQVLDSLKTLTSLDKEVRPFLLSDNSIWTIPFVSSRGDYSIWRSWSYSSLAIIAFGAFAFIVPKYYLVDVLDIFYFCCSGEGKGKSEVGVRRKFYWKSQEGGGLPEERGGGGAGRLSAGNLGFFFFFRGRNAPQILLSLRKTGIKEPRLLNLRRLRSWRFMAHTHPPHGGFAMILTLSTFPSLFGRLFF